jgi:Spy/CpxP family protein refolding chaperone
LRNGAGWGLALVAELNGVPGPAHLLNMRNQIAYNHDQFAAIEASFKQMKSQAREYGVRLIELERALGDLFKNGSADTVSVRAALGKIATTRLELRYVHLATHLEMMTILSTDQISQYNQLRGYEGLHQ